MFLPILLGVAIFALARKLHADVPVQLASKVFACCPEFDTYPYGDCDCLGGLYQLVDSNHRLVVVKLVVAAVCMLIVGRAVLAEAAGVADLLHVFREQPLAGRVRCPAAEGRRLVLMVAAVIANPAIPNPAVPIPVRPAAANRRCCI